MRKITFCRNFIAFLLIFVISGIAVAQKPASEPSGEWVLKLGQRTLLALSLHSAHGEGQPFGGSMSRPQHFQTKDGLSYSDIQGPTEVDPIVASTWKGKSISITVQRPDNLTDKETFLLTLQSDTHAQLEIEGVPIPPISLVRADGTPSVSTDWESGRTYSPDDDAPSNPAMKRIFDEDQRVRQAGFNIDWPSVNKSDAERRQATMKLLNDGELHSGEDFDWAAVIFQHGPDSNDYLLAHTLAMIAVRKGYTDAIWQASATLDRYLQSIKQPQIYGTQFLTLKGVPTTQEPYNRTLISNALRHQLDVPDLAAQAARCKQYDVERKNAK